VRQRVVLGGLSMGGYVALAFYRRFPHRVRALVLADTRAQGDDEDGKRTREETARLALSEGMAPVAEAMLPKLLAPATHEQDPGLVERVRAMILSTKLIGAAAALRGMALRPDQTDFLPRILSPTLVLVGAEDKLTPLADSEVMRREIRGSRLEVLDGAAHLSNLERPAEFNRALKTFLADIEP
jgi:pimeloyl-ACP methyl ester carboxylesterase